MPTNWRSLSCASQPKRLLGIGRGEVELGLVGAGLVSTCADQALSAAAQSSGSRSPPWEASSPRVRRNAWSSSSSASARSAAGMPHVGGDEGPMQEIATSGAWSKQQAPGGVVAAQGVGVAKSRGHGSGAVLSGVPQPRDVDDRVADLVAHLVLRDQDPPHLARRELKTVPRCADWSARMVGALASACTAFAAACPVRRREELMQARQIGKRRWVFQLHPARRPAAAGRCRLSAQACTARVV